MSKNFRLKYLFLLLSIVFSSLLLQAQTTKYETRAVWISVASGDWPSSFNKEEQQQSLLRILDSLHDLKFNTIYFQVRPRGNTVYRSSYEPWAQQLTGTLGKDPGWDPLEFAVIESHKRGLEIHAWFNTCRVWIGDPPKNSNHLLSTHREWVKKFESEWWVDFGIPEARDYTYKLVMELVNSYDLDGIHFDYIRYPGAQFDDWQSFLTYGGGTEKDEWRRNNITEFVRKCYESISQEKPFLKVGSAPIGIYQAMNGAQSSFSGLGVISQDSRRWLREGIHDYVTPQIYWSFDEQQTPYDPDFALLCSDWIREAYGRNIIIGIGAYRDYIRNELAEQIHYLREAHAEGYAIFKYSDLTSIRSQIRRLNSTIALPSAVPWKDTAAPAPPKNISTVKTNDGILLRWNMPETTAGRKLPFWFIVYRSLEDSVDISSPPQILTVLPWQEQSFLDDSPQAKTGGAVYTVTSLDRFGNESNRYRQAKHFPAQSFSLFETERDTLPVLADNFPNPFSVKTYFSYTLPKRGFVSLSLKHLATLRDTLLFYQMQEAGTHIVYLQSDSLLPGEYECILRSGTTILTKMIEKQ
ncbi:MAG: family 10 glycosylhydrolase [Bacteroidetes bacterium]|nr:family 10 glycosylhydrolase [Bacteroidota bacterium]